MPANASKGDHGHPDRGSQGGGGQKATQGTAVSPSVADAAGGAAGVGDAADADVGSLSSSVDDDDAKAAGPAH